MKIYTLFITVFLNALSAGFFYAWSVSVIAGTKKVTHFTYLETMQNINREILNPAFFIVFFGSLLSLIITTYLQFQNRPMCWLLLASTIIYLIGTFGVTAFGNVPLNNELDALNISNIGLTELESFRVYYEHRWNYYHSIRTVSNVISFTLLLLATFIQKLF